MKDLREGAGIHFVGIGGVSMSGLAQLAINRGFRVTGSDWTKSAVTEKLEALGADIVYGRGALNEKGIENASLVVYTAAAKADNPELIAARERGVRTADRAEFLGAVMKEFPRAVGVSGTHGKTTATGMIAHALIGAGEDPTVSIGGELDVIGGNFRCGKGDCFVTEACEYTNSFLKFYPTIALITNIEEDHLDFFSGIEEIRESFLRFASLTRGKGRVIAMADDENVKKVIARCEGLNVITYGMNPENDFYPENLIYHAGFPSFDVMKRGEKLCSLSLGVPGEHNVLNAIAAAAVCDALGVDAAAAAKGINAFKGTHRRFEKKGFLNGAVVIDDYAHHPTEIKATLKAAKRFPHNKIWCVFQPHTYSRTRTLWNEFVGAFDDADMLIMTHIYAAREQFDGITKPERLAEEINKTRGADAIYIESFEDIAYYLRNHVCEGDIVFTMGAGDVTEIGKMLTE